MIVKNKTIIKNGIAYIFINSKKYGKKVITMDVQDWLDLRVMEYSWYAHKHGNTFYARTHIGKKPNQKTLSMHKLILNNNPIGKPIINHIDYNGLNNCNSNIEYCDTEYNQLHARKRGTVCFDKRDKKYRAQANVNGKKEFFGYFNTEQDAVIHLTSLGLWRRD